MTMMTHKEWTRRADELERQMDEMVNGSPSAKTSVVTKTPEGMKAHITETYLFANIIKEGRQHMATLAKEWEDHEAAVKRICDRYAPSVQQEKIAELDAAFEEKRNEHSNSFSALVKKTVDAKRAAINEMVAVAPTTEQLNLLQALQLQGEFNEGEINMILPHLIGNYRALATLRGMAKKAGYALLIPAQFDYAELTEYLDWTEKYLADRCHDMATFNGEVGDFFGKTFFDTYGGGHDDPNFKNNAIDMFDSNMQIQTPFKVKITKEDSPAKEETT